MKSNVIFIYIVAFRRNFRFIYLAMSEHENIKVILCFTGEIRQKKRNEQNQTDDHTSLTTL